MEASGEASTSSQPPQDQKDDDLSSQRTLSSGKRAVAKRESRARAAVRKGNVPGQWGGARQPLPTEASAAVAITKIDASAQTQTDASTQTDPIWPEQQDVARLSRLNESLRSRYYQREYECELEEGREGDISQEPGWAPGLIASLALNIDRLSYDLLQLTQAVRELGNVVQEADAAALPEVTHELLRQLELCTASSTFSIVVRLFMLQL